MGVVDTCTYEIFKSYFYKGYNVNGFRNPFFIGLSFVCVVALFDQVHEVHTIHGLC